MFQNFLYLEVWSLYFLEEWNEQDKLLAYLLNRLIDTFITLSYV